jgi:ProP effector
MPKINPVEILTFPQTFGSENYRRHLPLKIGVDRDIMDRCPAISRSERNVTLRFYTSRLAYLQSLIEGVARVDLDGNPAGIVSAADAERAAARLTEVLAELEARRAAAEAARRAVKKPATMPATAALKPAPAPKSPTSEPAWVLPAISPRVQRPLLSLPVFREKTEAVK